MRAGNWIALFRARQFSGSFSHPQPTGLPILLSEHLGQKEKSLPGKSGSPCEVLKIAVAAVFVLSKNVNARPGCRWNILCG